MAETPPVVVTVDVAPAFMSKINWVAAATAALALLASFGLEIPEQTKTMILTVIPVVGSILVVILKTWFTTTVTPSSVKGMT